MIVADVRVPNMLQATVIMIIVWIMLRNSNHIKSNKQSMLEGGQEFLRYWWFRLLTAMPPYLLLRVTNIWSSRICLLQAAKHGCFLTWRNYDKMAVILQTTYLNEFWGMENLEFVIDILTLVTVMAWHRKGSKPLSDQMMACWTAKWATGFREISISVCGLRYA